jgi:hypothetical protein
MKFINPLLNVVLPPPMPTLHRLHPTILPDAWKSRPNEQLMDRVIRATDGALNLQMTHLTGSVDAASTPGPAHELKAKRMHKIYLEQFRNGC